MAVLTAEEAIKAGAEDMAFALRVVEALGIESLGTESFIKGNVLLAVLRVCREVRIEHGELPPI